MNPNQRIKMLLILLSVVQLWLTASLALAVVPFEYWAAAQIAVVVGLLCLGKHLNDFQRFCALSKAEQQEELQKKKEELKKRKKQEENLWTYIVYFFLLPQGMFAFFLFPIDLMPKVATQWESGLSFSLWAEVLLAIFWIVFGIPFIISMLRTEKRKGKKK